MDTAAQATKKNAEKAADTQTLHEGCLTNVEFE